MKKIKPSVGDWEGIKIKKKPLTKEETVQRTPRDKRTTKLPWTYPLHGHNPSKGDFCGHTSSRETSMNTLPLIEISMNTSPLIETSVDTTPSKEISVDTPYLGSAHPSFLSVCLHGH